MNRKGEYKVPGWVIVVVILVLIGAFTNWYGFAKKETPTDTTVVAKKDCPNEDLSWYGICKKIGASGTSCSGYHRLFVKGATGDLIDYGLVADSAAMTVPTYTDFVAYLNENSTTYYTVKITGNTDCTDPYKINAQAGYIETALTATFFNENGIPSAQPIGADETVEVSVQYKTAADKFYGNPSVSANNVLICEYNKTQIKSVEVIGQKKVANPQWYTASLGTDSAIVTYEIPKVGDGVPGINKKAEVDIRITSQQSVNPSNDIVCTFGDVDIDLDQDTLAEIIGVEDEDGNDIGDTTTQTVTLDLS